MLVGELPISVMGNPLTNNPGRKIKNRKGAIVRKLMPFFLIAALVLAGCGGSHAQSKAKPVPRGMACQLMPQAKAEQLMNVSGLIQQPVDLPPGASNSTCDYLKTDLNNPSAYTTVHVNIWRQGLKSAQADYTAERQENHDHLREVQQNSGHYRNATVQVIDLEATPALYMAKYAAYSHVRKYGYDDLAVNNGAFTVMIRLHPYSWAAALEMATTMLARLPAH
jgi:hypothetical protein